VNRRPFPPRPTSIAELKQALRTLIRVPRPRTLQQAERQSRAFMMHVVGDMTIRQIASKLAVSKNTILSDLRYEHLLRLEEGAGKRTDYAEYIRRPQRSLNKADLCELFATWGIDLGDAPQVEAFLAEIGARKRDDIGTTRVTRARAREGRTS